MSWGILKNIARRYFPAALAYPLRLLAVKGRYELQKRKASTAFKEVSNEYDNEVIFVAGMPKSGTSWMENLLSSYEGYHKIMIPEAVQYGVRHGARARDYKMPPDIFNRLSNMLAVLKLHIRGSEHNTTILHREKVPYLIMFRDPRDVAVSYVFYAKRTPWHPEYAKYRNLTIQEGLHIFSDSTLVDLMSWVTEWHKNRSRELSIVVRYEDLLEDTVSKFKRVASHFGLNDSEEKVRQVVRVNSFENSKSASYFSSHGSSFYREGTSGDWANYFDDDLEKKYKQKCGDFLIKYGYEDSFQWQN